MLALLAVERRCKTINYSSQELCGVGVVHRSKESQGPQLHKGGCAATWVGQKVTAGVAIHDVMLDLRLNGVGDKNLRCNLWARFGKICH